MGPFMAVIEKTDVLVSGVFAEMRCIFARISVQSAQSGEKLTDFPRIRKNPLQTGANSAMIPFVNRSLRKQAESGMYCPDP